MSWRSRWWQKESAAPQKNHAYHSITKIIVQTRELIEQIAQAALVGEALEARRLTNVLTRPVTKIQIHCHRPGHLEREYRRHGPEPPFGKTLAPNPSLCGVGHRHCLALGHTC